MPNYNAVLETNDVITGVLHNPTLKGDTGTGIESISMNQDYTLTIIMDDGTSYTTDSIRGEQGEQGIQGNKGDTGNGVRYISIDSSGYLDITLDDGTSYRFYVKGDKGNKGDKGDKGDPGEDATISEDVITEIMEEYLDEHPLEAPVTSVNSQTGDVVLSIPSKTSDITNDSGFQTSDDVTSAINTAIASVMHYKGTVATALSLPSSGNTVGDVYHVTERSSEYAWDGTQWQELGTEMDLSSYATKNWVEGKGYLISHQDISGKANTADLASVATSGSYNDLSNKPSIPTKTSDITNDSGYVTQEDVKEQILSDDYTEEKVPYLYREAPYSVASVEEKIVGGTVGWNQLCNGASVTVTSGHKYYMIKGGVKSIGASTGTAITGLTSGTDIVTDITIMFGSTIADYIYSLETATAGAGVAKLKEWGFFTEDYYEYCEPTLKSVEGLVSKKTVGFNQWDEEWEAGSLTQDGNDYASTTRIRSKGFNPILEETDYYCLSATTCDIHFYDGNHGHISSIQKRNGTFTTPNGAKFFRFCEAVAYGTTYNHDICINLSDPTRNGQYEPYESLSYSLDSEVVLRGIPKLDSSNNLYYDGDTYESDGTVSRRFTERAYQSGDESLTDAITDGTTTVVKLATPTTETALPYHNPQIVGDTEEWVTTGIVPVGHNTKYYAGTMNLINSKADKATTYTKTEVDTALSAKAGTATATTSANGLMSSTDKGRLDDLYADYSSAMTALGVN